MFGKKYAIKKVTDECLENEINIIGLGLIIRKDNYNIYTLIASVGSASSV